MLDYRQSPGPTTKSPLKQKKHPYEWSTIEYNSINNGTSENII